MPIATSFCCLAAQTPSRPTRWAAQNPSAKNGSRAPRDNSQDALPMDCRSTFATEPQLAVRVRLTQAPSISHDAKPPVIRFPTPPLHGLTFHTIGLKPSPSGETFRFFHWFELLPSVWQPHHQEHRGAISPTVITKSFAKSGRLRAVYLMSEGLQSVLMIPP